MLMRLLLILAAFFTALPAAAQDTHLVPQLLAEGPLPLEGGEVTLALHFKTEPGWHGYWLNPGDAGLPLSVDWTLPEGASISDFQYPTPVRFDAFGLVNYVYKKDHALLATLRVPQAPAGALTIRGEGRWLACTDKVCVPEKGSFSLVLPVGEGPDRSAEFDQFRRKLPRPIATPATFEAQGDRLSLAIPVPASLEIGKPEIFIAENGVVDYAAPYRFRRVGDQLVADLVRKGEAVPESVSGVLAIDGGQGLSFTAMPGDVPGGGKSVGEAGLAVVLIAIAGALVGGMLLNLMPCVFPILAMKAVHLGRAGGDPREARRDALGYLAGAVIGTASLGLLLLAIRAGGNAAGWAFQLQDPRTIFILLLLAAAITFNLAGLFRLPVLAGNVRTSGSVGTGALAAFVATPCAGPFLGAALGTALILPAMGALGVFAALGLGLALPFVLVAFVPALRRRLPSPGPWMARFQRWLAIPMAATVAATLWLLWRLSGETALWLGVAAVLLLGLLLWLSNKARWLGWAALVAGLAMATGGAMLLPDRPSAESRIPEGTLAWSEEAVAKARNEGKTVFVYFTADWCLTCKANEAGAIQRDAVQEVFDEAGVVTFVGDWTDGDPAITRFLEERGRAAVPLYLWYAPGAEEPEELPQILTPSMLISRAQSRE
ncbi:protein-disulfide reductase DsbD family protein [Sphingomicrobium lutaoense]|uniref:DsbC/DsbD-like thiol-disulfide interchange protein/cytochrome c biogenesis protein CcdA n=1 Tax=Sphingomicrobium lutaoense TaxID=515949 RepID=A0A839Z2M7_9SPHN|nr:protein-disulfide reductase DsbD domain-containing protein [Sphingomicrobium lutaoense]MBB3764307.1 DsbC/DsbD-like thiol-disulfide interchange protein/cytochrome c biogenesis protein CcdA [Sphingomicrobium lutaoense]